MPKYPFTFDKMTFHKLTLFIYHYFFFFTLFSFLQVYKGPLLHYMAIGRSKGNQKWQNNQEGIPGNSANGISSNYSCRSAN